MELPVKGWRIWYGDGTTFSSEDGSWDDAPSTNVQVLEVLHDPAPYRTLSHGDDEYRLTPDSSVKYGAWMYPDEEYEALVQRVFTGGE